MILGFALFQRLPWDVLERDEFHAQLYFSPVCPLSGLGEPPGRVHYIEMKVKKSGKPVILILSQCIFHLIP